MRTAALRCERGRASRAPGRSSSPTPCPGNTPIGSSSPDRRAIEAAIAAGSPPGRSTLPHPPANKVSPLKRSPSSSASRQTEPSVCPGVWRTRRRISPNRMSPPSASSTAGTDGDDLERRPHRLRVGQSLAVERMDRDLRAGVFGDRGVVADVIPVPVGRDDELERPVAGGQLIGDPGQRRRRGVDRDRFAGPRVRKDMDVRRDRPDDAVESLHPRIVAGGRTGGRSRATGAATPGHRRPRPGLLEQRRREQDRCVSAPSSPATSRIEPSEVSKTVIEDCTSGAMTPCGSTPDIPAAYTKPPSALRASEM